MRSAKTLRCLSLLGCVLLSAFAVEKKGENAMASASPIYCVLSHSPGPKWKEKSSFKEQPGVLEHVKYFSDLAEKGTLLMGGPFLDNSGGMMILKTQDIEEAKRLGEADPAVKSQLLKVTVRQWLVPMSTLTSGNK